MRKIYFCINKHPHEFASKGRKTKNFRKIREIDFRAKKHNFFVFTPYSVTTPGLIKISKKKNFFGSKLSSRLSFR